MLSNDVNEYSLRYWHPVILVNKVERGPIAVRLCGQDIVLFRSSNGELQALADRCAHRRMRLSRGSVVGDRLVCPYHSWSYSGSGCGASPGNPQLTPRVKAYATREANGYCWIRDEHETGAVQAPQVEHDGYEMVHHFSHDVAAPFRLLMDNMAELEHTIAVHDKFGFGVADIASVKTTTTICDGSDLHIYYEGIQRPVPKYLSWFAGLRGGDRFEQRAVIKFGPVYATYLLEWFSAASSTSRPFALKFVIFYNPVDATRCQQFTFVLLKRTFSRLLKPLVVPILARIVEREILSDIRLVEALTADAVDPARHQLGRFDQPLISARRLISKQYLGLENV